MRDTFDIATELAARYRISPLTLRGHLTELYSEGEVPAAHVEELAQQIETQTRHYERREEHVERALAIVREDGFSSYSNEEGGTAYFTEINYPVVREHYLSKWETHQRENRKNLGFHYDPIEFDSQPEQSFFDQVLRKLNVEPWEVEDVYFTGGLTDPAKTDFFVEYRTADSKWRRYTPDFIIRKKASPGSPAGTGRVLIVEIKREKDRQDPIDGIAGAKASAVRRWEEVNPERVKYEMIFTPNDTVAFDQLRPVWAFAGEPELPIPIDMSRLRAFCEKWHVADLALFGSVLRSDFRPDSDLDFLVSFKPDAPALGFGFFHMEEELKVLIGRDVDLVSRKGIERSQNWIRRKNILNSARSIYVG
jgi:predicted nucleotidyltransferase